MKSIFCNLLMYTAVAAIVSQACLAGSEAYKVSPAAIPCRIEASDYDRGGPGVGYSVSQAKGTSNWYRQDGVDIEDCADYGGYDLGWATAGNWFRYTVAVPAAGRYTVAFRVSSGAGGGSLHLADAAGKNLTGAVQVSGTGGWQVWTTVYARVVLPAGLQTLTLVEDTGGYNIHYLNIDPGNLVPPPPVGLTVSPGDDNAVLMWTSSPGATSYTVLCGTSTQSLHPIATGLSMPRYACNGLRPGVKYTFSVVSVILGNSSAQSKVVSLVANHSRTPDFGPNVLVFDPKMPASTIQSQLDSVFERQQANQFGVDRYALMFKPGAYNAMVKIGFYTQALGLGLSPDDTSITGAVQVDAAWFGGNATCNFWRGAENLAVTPVSGPSVWAVSQACPLRRMHIKGDLVLDDHGGWSSGGFLSDSVIDGKVNSGSQQQWLTRNSTCGSWTGANWNSVFVGVNNAPGAGIFPRPPYTVVQNAPIVREKPFLIINPNEGYSVFVPAFSGNSNGSSWQGRNPAGTSIPISQFYIAHADTDTALTINTALNRGLNVLFTPGNYSLNAPIRISRPNTVVLGLGLATLKPVMGTEAMQVADVGGVVVAGLLFDAGLINSPVLLEVGPKGSSADHDSNPTTLDDLFFRVGGAGEGKATVSLCVNSSDVIGDDLWLWRADHSIGVGWDTNAAANGLIVNGENVTMYGLAVEHYEQYQTLWNGNGGRVYFYQSEAPYDVPNANLWTDGSASGFASYKVADNVTSHQAWGLGVYCAFTNHSVTLDSAIQAPSAPGVRFVDMTTVSLGGQRKIARIINNSGNTADHSSMVARLRQYP